MKGQKIIIKKVKKRGHAAAHGGSWKVAYADFVTAMMAFFLLLWLLSMASPEKRARVSSYFKEFNIFEKAGTTMMLDQFGGVMGGAGGELTKLHKDFGKAETDTITPGDLRDKVKHEVETKLSDVQDQVIVDIFESGVRIQLTDKVGKPLFSIGGAELSPTAKKILEVITENIKSVDNKIAIEGHTDALSYTSSRYTNWELSTDRASAARKELEHNGLDPDKISRVSGYAASEPLVKNNPNDPMNRRISIILIHPQARIETGIGDKQTPLVK